MDAEKNAFACSLMDRYKEAKRIRMPFEADWRRIAELGIPRQYGGWVTTNSPTGDDAGYSAARTARLNTYDSTLGRSLRIYAAVMERLLTPGSQKWHVLQADSERDRQSVSVKRALDKLNDLLFRRRYEPAARYTVSQSATYLSCGAYGNAGKLIVWREPNKQMRRRGGLLYRNVPFRNLFWEIDDEDNICCKFRRIDWTARQALSFLGDRCPKRLADEAKRPNADNARKWEFVHVIRPNHEWDEGALDYRRHRMGSYYVFVEEPELVKDPGGYSSDPLIISRMGLEGGSLYGYGAAQIVLSTVGVLNAQVKTWLRQGQLAVQPTLLVRDDGVMNVELTPGAQIAGGVNSAGQKMVQPLEQGNFQIVEQLIQAERSDVKEVLMATIFEVVRDQPQKTATEILDIAAREAAQVAPTMGGMQADDLGPQIDRELLLLAENGALSAEEFGILSDLEYSPIYTSPLAKSQHSESVSGFMRITEMAINIAQATQDSRPVRRLNFDKALPAIAEYQSVPADWIKSDDEMLASDAAAADAAQTQQTIDALPAAASIAKTMADNKMKPAA